MPEQKPGKYFQVVNYTWIYSIVRTLEELVWKEVYMFYQSQTEELLFPLIYTHETKTINRGIIYKVTFTSTDVLEYELKIGAVNDIYDLLPFLQSFAQAITADRLDLW